MELFSRLTAWDSTVLAGNRALFDGARIPSEGILKTISVTPYSGNGLLRIVNWASYSIGAMARGLRMRELDIVYASSPHLGAGLAGLIVARVRRVPFVLEIRDLWPQILVEAGTMSSVSLIYRTLKWLEMFLYRQADRIVVLAEGSGRALEEQGVPSDKIVFIPNGADPEDFEVAEDRVALRERFGFDRFTAVYAGAHGPANGLQLVLDAAEQLQSDGVDADFVLVGDGVSKQELRECVARRSLTNVRFLDPIATSEVPARLAAADVGLHCLADVELFKTGVSPNKLYDYMAAGLPVLTNTGGDTAAMVNDVGSGRAVVSDQIAVGVAELYGLSTRELESCGRAGVEYMSRSRSRTAMAFRIQEVLSSLVPQPPQAGARR